MTGGTSRPAPEVSDTKKSHLRSCGLPQHSLPDPVLTSLPAFSLSVDPKASDARSMQVKNTKSWPEEKQKLLALQGYKLQWLGGYTLESLARVQFTALSGLAGGLASLCTFPDM